MRPFTAIPHVPAPLARSACTLALCLAAGACRAPQPVEPSETAQPPLAQTPARGTPTQPGERAVPDKPFGLTLEEYWTNPWKNLKELSWKIVGDETSGIMIDCPETVARDLRPTVPLLVFVSGENNALAGAPFTEHAVVAAIDLDRNELRAGSAFTIEAPRPRSERAPPAGFTGAEFMIDLRARGLLGQEPGRYLITIIVRDQVSNRVPLRIGPAVGLYKDEEVESFLREKRAQLPPSAVEPNESDQMVRYGDGAGCPPVPGTPGIALTADRVVVAEPGARGLLCGSFRLPVLANDLIKSPDRHPGLKPRVGRPGATAVVPISLLIIGADSGGVRAMRLQVPSFSKLMGDPDNLIATGYFRLDLLQDEEVTGRPQTYFIYAFSGEAIAGPATMAVVAKAQAPSR